jgi:AcrR family transcriptional regulator
VGTNATTSVLLTPGSRPKGLATADAGDPAGEVDLLVDATVTVAARQGSFEPSVREILDEAGLSTKAFYRHFGSKDELLLMAVEVGSRRLRDYIESKMAASDDPVTRIKVWIESFVRHTAMPTSARRTLPWTLGIGRLEGVYPEYFDRGRTTVSGPLRQEIARAVGQSSAQSSNPTRDAKVIFDYTMEAIRHHWVHGTQPKKDTVRHLVDFTYRALGVGTTA